MNPTLPIKLYSDIYYSNGIIMDSRNVGDFDVFPILSLIITAHSRQAVSRKYDFNLVVVK